MDDLFFLDAPLSQDEDTDLLQSFVRHHVVNVVHPVTEQMRDLQTKVAAMSASLATLDARSGDNMAKVNQLQDELATCRVEHAKTTAAMDKTERDLAVGNSERARLVAEQDKTWKVASEVRDSLGGTNDSIKALQLKSSDLEGQLRSLAQGLWKTDKNFDNLSETIRSLKESQEELKDKHAEHIKELHALHRSSSENSRNLGILTQQLEQELEGRNMNVSRLEELIADLERNATLHQRRLEHLQDEAKQMAIDMHKIRDSVEHHDGTESGLDRLKVTMTELQSMVKGHSKHFERVEGAMEKLGDSLCAEKQSVGSKLMDLGSRLDGATADITAVGKVAKELREEVPRQSLAVQEHQVSLMNLMEQASTTQDEMRNVATWQKAAASAVEMHALEMQKFRDESGSRERRLSSAEELVLRMEKDFGKMAETLVSLNKRFDKRVVNMVKPFQEAEKDRVQSPCLTSTTAGPTPGFTNTTAPSPRYQAACGRPSTASGGYGGAGLLEASLPILKTRPMSAFPRDPGAQYHSQPLASPRGLGSPTGRGL